MKIHAKAYAISPAPLKSAAATNASRMMIGSIPARPAIPAQTPAIIPASGSRRTRLTSSAGAASAGTAMAAIIPPCCGASALTRAAQPMHEQDRPRGRRDRRGEVGEAQVDRLEGIEQEQDAQSRDRQTGDEGYG